MKKFNTIIVLLLVGIMSMSLLSCQRAVTATGVTITNKPTGNTLNLSLENYTFNASIAPSGAKGELEWSSSNASVMTIDPATGAAELKSGGVTTVSVAIKGKELNDSVLVTVVDDVNISGVSITNKPVNGTILLSEETYQFNAATTPAGVAADLVWESSDTSVLSVSSTGLATLKKGGLADVTVKVEDAPSIFDKVSIFVDDGVDPLVPQGVIITRPALDTVKLADETHAFTANIVPGTAVGTVVWASSDTSVAEIDADTGVASLLKVGITTITATVAGTEIKQEFMLTVSLEGSYSANLMRAIQMHNTAIANYTQGDNYHMYNYVNHTVSTSRGTVNNYEYTTILESLNAIIGSLKEIKDLPGADPMFQTLFVYYTHEFYNAYRGIDYYLATVTYASYTRPSTSWIMPKVGRNTSVNLSSNGGGRNTLYDDAMWMIREFMIAYNYVKDEDPAVFKGSMYPGRMGAGVDVSNLSYADIYLMEAEYMTEFCIDGWVPGFNHGGILQGPNHDSINTCANGPFIAPLVWLAEVYEGKADTIEARYYQSHANPRIVTENKSEYYLSWAERVYEFTYNNMRRPDGVYGDLIRGYSHSETNGYRIAPAGTRGDFDHTPYAYNSGSVLSGLAELYRFTGKERYKDEAIALANAARRYFHNADESGLTWFADKSEYMSCLLRSYVELDLYGIYDTAPHISDLQQLMNYGYDNWYRNGCLPYDLVYGWSHGKNDGNASDKSDARTDLQMTFGYTAIFGHLARHELVSQNS